MCWPEFASDTPDTTTGRHELQRRPRECEHGTFLPNFIGEKVNCEEKTRLLMEYQVATSEFSEAVRALRGKIGTSPKEEYKRLERISNEARVRSEQARLFLEQHIAAHRC
jgi:hypothetical protein